jgi:4'-phosphopantetheinyl transferase
MIHWLIQSSSDHPDLARGVAPAGLLSDVEEARLAALKIDKRRRDWLLGRWTAKRLIQTYLEQRTGLCLPLTALVIEPDPNGAPCLIVASPYHHLPAIRNLRVSISHSGGRAFCALVEDGDIGVDIERIEPRDWQFVEDYFNAEEILRVRLAPAEQYETVITAIWSAKEAALKALRRGLTVDTHSLSCYIPALEHVDDWSAFDIVCDRRLLDLPLAPSLAGWWRRMDDFALTVAATHSGRVASKSMIQRAALSC